MAIYKDIDISFERNKSGDLKSNKDNEAVKNSLRNIALIKRGTRRMRPLFSNSYSTVFDPIDDESANELVEETLENIENGESRVLIQKVYVKKREDRNTYEVTLFYTIPELKISDSVNITFTAL